MFTSPYAPEGFQYPTMLCDVPLHRKLEKHGLTQHLNKTFCALFLGQPGSGKTSTVEGLCRSKSCFHHVFTRIEIFMPEGSRASIQDSPFEDLPANQLHDGLEYEELERVVDNWVAYRKKHGNKKMHMLMIFDDVQNELKGPCERLLTRYINNRRHMRICFIIVAQSYKKIPPMVRKSASDIFAFKLSRMDINTARSELWDMNNDEYNNLLDYYIEESKKQKSFLYVNCPTGHTFINWREVQYQDQDHPQIPEG